MAASVKNVPFRRPFFHVFSANRQITFGSLPFCERGIILRQPRLYLSKITGGVNPASRKIIGKKFVIGVGAAVVGTGVVWYDVLQQRNVRGAETSRPLYKPVRQIRSNTDDTGLKLTLYQYQSCPFCCKVRAYLDYRGFSYDVVEVNSVWRTETKWSKYKKVPILVCEGLSEDGYLQLNDSSVIISTLETFLQNGSASVDQILTYYPEMVDQKTKKVDYGNKYRVMLAEQSAPVKGIQEDPALLLERKWREWTDKHLVHVLSPNIYRTLPEAVRSFKHFSTVGEWERIFSTPQRLFVIYVGATAMYLLSKYLKVKYKLQADVRESLYDAANEWLQQGGIGKDRFQGGERPNLADLSVYGVLTAIEGTPAFDDMVARTKIRWWYYRTKKAVEDNAGIRLEDKDTARAATVTVAE